MLQDKGPAMPKGRPVVRHLLLEVMASGQHKRGVPVADSNPRGLRAIKRGRKAIETKKMLKEILSIRQKMSGKSKSRQPIRKNWLFPGFQSIKALAELSSLRSQGSSI